ncbi:MAG: hypothetical protein M3024_01405 [Candidatus Dormibacteraeota bacterium]|nr:hypothetical protein [Candidatus Dormibacteraeota bacterium]MDQ6900210.1 hypothetical protein [Candidatus Dormibacteraeota bacterium]
MNREFYVAAAELAQLAGWAAHDVGHQDEAEHWLSEALGLAAAAGDDAYAGEVLAGQSQQALWLGEVGKAMKLALMAQESATRAGVWPLLAEACVAEAHSHARAGERQLCEVALHQADRAFDRSTGKPRPDWLQYFDEAYLAARAAHCWRDLGDFSGNLNDMRQAERLATRSLDMDHRFVRGRQFNLALLASTQVVSDLQQACEGPGYQALKLAAGLRSTRARSYLEDLQRRLAQHPKERLVCRFNEQVREVLGPPPTLRQ